MTAEEVLRSNEESAVGNSQFISSVMGKGGVGGSLKMKKKFGAAIFITLMLVVFLVFFTVGNLIPSAISERLIEETDVQYADAMQTKTYVFQKAMKDGDVPSNTAARLANAGVIVGHGTAENFTESNSGANLSLKIGNKVITADEFPEAVMQDVRLYDAFNSATYGRAAYYYDSSAQTAFEQIGSSRNNYKDSNKSFDEVMTDVVGEGNNINVGVFREVYYNVGADDIEGSENMSREELAAAIERRRNAIKQDCEKNKGGYREEGNIIICYESNGVSGEDASVMVNSVGGSYNAQDASSILSIADTIAKEQKSSSYYLGVMENISKMKAGQGSDSRINEAMNYLYQETESEVVDVETGQVITVTGSPLESPSLYSVLSGEKLDINSVQNYSTERLMRVMNNNQSVGDDAITGSYTSTSTNIRGTIGRLFASGQTGQDAINSATTIIDSSLVKNSFETINGINAGEMLVEGAVNVGAALALQSGATVGTADAVVAYRKLTDKVLAMDAEVDRMKRSPLDITSKNTFLGSIVYKFAMSTIKSGTLLNKVASLSRVTASSISSILPSTYADDENTSYMTSFGECERMDLIGAEGTAGCSRDETFDMSTVDISDNTYIQMKNKNVTCDESTNVCTINKGSDFEKFVRYNVARITPVGATDGGILKALRHNGESTEYSKISFINSLKELLAIILQKIKNLFDSTDMDIATGKAFVNPGSSGNSEYWETYKYAQRYLSEVRAVENLRMYDGDQTAYSNIPYIGVSNPVIACLEDYYAELLAMAESGE